MTLRVFVLVSTVVVAGCNTPTQVFVHIDAESDLSAVATRLVVRACEEARAPRCEGGYLRSHELDGSPVVLPVTIPIGPPVTPSDRFWISADLLGEADELLGTVRAISGFRSGEATHLNLRFESACRTENCGSRSTCFSGGCTDACYLPVLSVPAEPSEPASCGFPDAGIDAVVDAGIDTREDVPGEDTTPCDCPCPSDECSTGICLPVSPIRQVAAGLDHTCAVDDDGRARCWGDNSEGQLGLGDEQVGSLVSAPTLVPLPNSVDRLAAGMTNTCAILTDGSMQCWGKNNFRFVDEDVDPVAAPMEVMRPDGQQWASASIFGNHICAITNGDQLFCWGSAYIGQSGTVDEPFPAVVRVPTMVGTGYIAVDVGLSHTCALTSGGQPFCFGQNSRAQLGAPVAIESQARPRRVDDFSGSTTLAVGAQHNCLIVARTGQMRCWGAANVGKIGDGNILGQRETPSAVTSDQVWTAVSLGVSQSCGLTDAGRLFCWGGALEGQLGLGEPRENQAVPQEVLPSGDWSTMSAGHNHTCAVRADGTLYCWGAAGSGQLSDSCGRTATSTPCRVCTGG